MNKKGIFLATGVVTLSLLSALAALPFLPKEIAVQWDINGQATNTLGSWAVLLFPLVSGGITVLNIFQNPTGMEKRSPWIAAAVGAVLLFAQLFVTGAALKWW